MRSKIPMHADNILTQISQNVAIQSFYLLKKIRLELEK